jgi:hypothetical protein
MSPESPAGGVQQSQPEESVSMSKNSATPLRSHPV